MIISRFLGALLVLSSPLVWLICLQNPGGSSLMAIVSTWQRSLFFLGLVGASWIGMTLSSSKLGFSAKVGSFFAIQAVFLILIPAFFSLRMSPVQANLYLADSLFNGVPALVVSVGLFIIFAKRVDSSAVDNDSNESSVQSTQLSSLAGTE